MREPDFEPSSWFEPSSLEVQKQSVSIRKNRLKHPICMLFNTRFYKHVLLVQEKVLIEKIPLFRNFEFPYFCTVFPTICGTVVKKKKISQGARFQGFGDFSAHFEVEEGQIFWFGMCHKTAGFTTWCLSLWCRRYLWRVPWSQMMCFYAVSLSGTMILCYSKKPPLAATQAFGLRTGCGPEHCRFSRTSHGCLPISCDTRGSKVPAILRDWQELDAEQAVLRARSTKRSPRERGLKLDCAV